MARLSSPVLYLPPLLLGALISAASPDDYQATREALVGEINTARRSAGVEPLRLSAGLSALAQERAAQAAAGRPASQAPAEEDAKRLRKQGYETRFLSEVEARADGSVDEVVRAWLADTGGTARDLTRPDGREIGIGVSYESETPIYVLIFALSWEDFFQRSTGALSNLERVRAAMLARVNRERSERGLAPLRRHPRLDDAAQAHADDMFRRRYYSHDTPEGKTAMDRIQAMGYRAKYAGENIARGQYSVDEVMDGWMESKTHREHLLSLVFDDVGFGLAYGKNPGGYEILWVQNFGRPKGRERL